MLRPRQRLATVEPPIAVCLIATSQPADDERTVRWLKDLIERARASRRAKEKPEAA